ncbi:MAG: hypothetical protein K8J31_19430, partial [Anaerolineae bacterium]|nr:hypothetical protein [Anaerolineae bacterium]
VGTTVSACVLALAPSLYVTLLAAAIGGASWTGAGIGLFGYFSEKTSPEPRVTTLYMQIISLASFCGPLIGSNLANAGVNLSAVILGGALLRLAAATVVFYGLHQVFPILTGRPLRLARHRR